MNPLVSQPFFLIGSERSGSTLLGLMLKNHPLISWMGQFEYAVKCIPDDGGWPILKNYYEALKIDRIFIGSNFKIDKKLTFPELVRSFVEQRKQIDNLSLVGAAIHQDFHKIPSIWSKSKFLYLLRDGRDVTNSCIKMGWAGNFWCGAQRWIDAESQCELLRRRVEPSRYLEIRYEELVTAPVANLKKICDFLEIDFNSRMLDYDKSSTYGKPNPNLIFQWKTRVAKRSIQICEARIRDRLLTRNYELSQYEELHVGRLRKIWFRFQDKFYRVSFRIKRYGLLTIFLKGIYRRLHLNSLHDQIKLGMIEVDKKELK